jgi:excisionase family DNA binding protein
MPVCQPFARMATKAELSRAHCEASIYNRTMTEGLPSTRPKETSRPNGVETAAKPPTEKPRLLKAQEVAKQLGCSRQNVYSLVNEGRLAGIKTADGTRFNPAEVSAFAETYRKKPRCKRRARSFSAPRVEVSGERCAIVFRLLAQGATLRAIVHQCELHPAIVRDLRREFLTSFEAHDRQKAHEREQAEERAAQRHHDKQAAREEAHRRRLEVARVMARGGNAA